MNKIKKTFLFFAFFVGSFVLVGITLIVKGTIYPGHVTPADETELVGYRPLFDSDIGKEFGVELDEKIYFDFDYEVGYEIYGGVSPGSVAGILLDCFVPGSTYRLNLRSTGIIDKNYGTYSGLDVFFSRGANIEDNKTLIYDCTLDDDDDFLLSYKVTYYTMPEYSYINDIYYSVSKDFILVKDIVPDLTDYEEGYANGYDDGFDDGKEAYGGYIDGQWYTAEDFGAWEYDRGLNDSIDVLDVLIGGIFGSLTALGNVEILPGLKIFYVVGIFVVFGVVGFIIQKKFGGDD